MNTLVSMLESKPLVPVTTARLAHQVGVSEAALYKHFPSKDRMFVFLIELTESLLNLKVDQVRHRNVPALMRCFEVSGIWLSLAEEYPGLACVLSGSFLQGGSEHLNLQHMRLCERFELQLRRLFKEAASKDGVRLKYSQTACARLLMSFLEGCTGRFVRSSFALKPSQDWTEYWKALRGSLVQ